MSATAATQPGPMKARRKALLGVAICAAVMVIFVTINVRGVTESAGDQSFSGSALPFDSAQPPEQPTGALVIIGVIALSTFISEDLTCIGAGVAVAQGHIGFGVGAFACFLGIFVGDVLLFLAGRYLGRPAVRRAPLKWFLRDEDIAKSSAWFNRRGMAVIAASRFIPGMRLPTYFAAGLLKTDLARFAVYFLIAAAVWTPLLVGLSSVLGAGVIESALVSRQGFIVKLATAVASILIITKLARALSSYRGRRLAVGRFGRLRRWEFWPAWVFYIPVVCYVALLMLKHRSATLFTAANPAILAGGFIGESKIEILRGLARSNGYVARSWLIPASLDADGRVAAADEFMAENGLSFPVVLKPNEGQRGSGVSVVKSSDKLRDYLTRSQVDTIIQEYAAGDEFGVFYYRLPGERRGHIFAITEKRFPSVTGDGRRAIEELILADERAVCMAEFYLDKQKEHLDRVPRRGERFQLIDVGTHCRGAIFLDGGWARTPALEDAIDRVSRGFKGFYFGRYDVRAASVDDFKQGRNFKVIELNGVTSEATNIYDPNNSITDAYRLLFEQWRIAFEIGRRNRKRGVEPAGLYALLRMLVEYRKKARLHLTQLS